ncbi:ABC-three component system middle component 6 [Tepidibacter sp. Z1-5]|uniref:ABC-three component system middle component 6 n=1 Tax=Tepidibacter sp. Z1-5 TaxID=3134138 RepID=UPI0030BC54BC
MIVDFDNDPRNSIIYTSSIILSYLKCESNSKNLDDLCRYCLNGKMEYSIFFLSIDWMFLVGIIKEINKRNEVVLCD